MAGVLPLCSPLFPVGEVGAYSYPSPSPLHLLQGPSSGTAPGKAPVSRCPQGLVVASCLGGFWGRTLWCSEPPDPWWVVSSGHALWLLSLLLPQGLIP